MNQPDQESRTDGEQRLFDALRREPAYSLSSDFERRVLDRLTHAESRRDMVWLTVGVAGFALTAIIVVLLTGFRLNFGALKFISGYPGFISFGVGFILFLHWIDRKLIRKTSF